MKHYVRLDVSMKETSICVVDETRRGGEGRQGRIGTGDERGVVRATGLGFERADLKAGSLAAVMHNGRAAAGLPMVWLDARRLKVATSAMLVKTVRATRASLEKTWKSAISLENVGAGFLSLRQLASSQLSLRVWGLRESPASAGLSDRPPDCQLPKPTISVLQLAPVLQTSGLHWFSTEVRSVEIPPLLRAGDAIEFELPSPERGGARREQRLLGPKADLAQSL